MLHKLKEIAKGLFAITWTRRPYESVKRAYLESFDSSRGFTQVFFIGNSLVANRETSTMLRGQSPLSPETMGPRAAVINGPDSALRKPEIPYRPKVGILRRYHD